jgi:hypothetical protein
MNDKPGSTPPSKPSNSGALIFLIALVAIVAIVFAVVRMNKGDMTHDRLGRPKDLPVGPQPEQSTP